MGIKRIVREIDLFFTKGDLRTINIKKQFIYSIIFKGLGIVFSFLSVPYMLDYLGKEKYGIWAVISSFFVWLTLFDFGLGNGMKNQVTKFIAVNDVESARKSISTAYWVIGILMIFCFLVIISLTPFFTWQRIINTTVVSESQLRIMFILMSIFMMINFFLSLINSVIASLQKSSFSELISVLLNILWFVSIYCLYYFSSGNLILVVILNGSASIFAYSFISILFFRRYPYLIPKFRLIDKTKIKEMLNTGVGFFIIQLSFLVIFTTDSLIITQVLGPESVTEYRIVFQLFTSIALLNSLLTANLWTGFGDAYFKGDFNWIKRILYKYNILLLGLIFLTIILILSTKTIIFLWLHKTYKISMLFIILMGLYNILNSWGSKYAYFLNGIGKIKLQLYLSIIAAIINVPLSWFFAKYLNMGIAGVILGSIISILFNAIALPIQTYNVLKNK